MNKKFVYQVSKNKKVILWCTAKRISRFAGHTFTCLCGKIWINSKEFNDWIASQSLSLLPQCSVY
jgi:hypothetical protein